MNLQTLRRNCRLPHYYSILAPFIWAIILTLLTGIVILLASITEFFDIVMLEYTLMMLFLPFAVAAFISWLIVLFLLPRWLFRKNEKKLCEEIRQQMNGEFDFPQGLGNQALLEWLAKQMGEECQRYSTIWVGGDWVVGPKAAIRLSHLAGIFCQGIDPVHKDTLSNCNGLIAISNTGRHVILDGLMLHTPASKITQRHFAEFAEGYDDIRDCYIDLISRTPGILTGDLRDFEELSSGQQMG